MTEEDAKNCIINAAHYLLNNIHLDEIDNDEARTLTEEVRNDKITLKQGVKLLTSTHGDYIVDWLEFNYQIEELLKLNS